MILQGATGGGSEWGLDGLGTIIHQRWLGDNGELTVGSKYLYIRFYKPFFGQTIDCFEATEQQTFTITVVQL